MARKQLTEKQQEIKTLLDRGMPVGEIADALGTTAQAVYAQISRMRRSGHLPKKAQPATRATRETGDAKEAFDAMIPPAVNGNSGSLEEHVEAELLGVRTRLEEIDSTVGKLTAEREDLTSRRTRLEAASLSLEGKGLLALDEPEKAAAA